jgi:tRNA threonylcarbamoyladenosine biosynthesis protein TsaB
MSWLLGLDGATDRLTLALVRPDSTDALSRDLPGGAQASSLLIPAVRALMADAGVGGSDLLAIGFGRGPGAFTSLRAICAVVQGLAEGWQRPVLPIESLLLSADDAAGAEAAPGRWAAVMDARMGEVYAAVYARRDAQWHLEMPPSLWQPLELATACAVAPPNQWAGNGVHLVPGAPEARPAQERGAALARLLSTAWQQGLRLQPQEAQPLYVRDRVALTTAERERLRQGASA